MMYIVRKQTKICNRYQGILSKNSRSEMHGTQTQNINELFEPVINLITAYCRLANRWLSVCLAGCVGINVLPAGLSFHYKAIRC